MKKVTFWTELGRGGGNLAFVSSSAGRAMGVVNVSSRAPRLVGMMASDGLSIDHLRPTFPSQLVTRELTVVASSKAMYGNCSSCIRDADELLPQMRKHRF